MAGIPSTPIQVGTFEMMNEVLSSLSAENLDTSRYQIPCLEDVDLHWEDPDLNLVGLSTRDRYSSFLSTFNKFEIGPMAEKPTLVDEEQKKELPFAPPTTLVSERTIRLPALLRLCPFGKRIETFHDEVYKTLFQKVILFR